MPRTILFISVALLGVMGSTAESATPDSRPNIIFVLCDDLGYGDLSCLNPQSRLNTPHFDRVAREGMVFTDAHSGSAVCTPTRYGLMTGRYCWRTPLQKHVLGGLSPRLIEPDRLTVAALLKEQGYHTACIGKWHLGVDWVIPPGKTIEKLAIERPDQVFNADFSQPFTNGPLTLGFDQYFGIAGSLDMVPYTFLEGDRVAVLPTAEKSFPMMHGHEKPRTRVGPAAPEFDANQVLPTFTQQAVAYLKSRAADAKTGQPFFLYLPFASPHTPIVPTAPWLGKSGLNAYGDFVLQQDDAIGQLLKTLDEQGLRENTLVIITSDNGCSPQAKFPELLAAGHNPSYLFRGMKTDIYEGGHRVPFLVRWPTVVQAGQRSDQLICLSDFMATCADVLNVELPPTAGEDSFSFLPALQGQPLSSERAVVHHSVNGSFAIRQGPWKLALCPGSGGSSFPRPGVHDTSRLPAQQLFQLQADIGEHRNLQGEHRDVVERLTALLEKIVSNGRSTPGPAQQNAVPVDIYFAGREAHKPLPPRNAPAN